MVNDLNHNKVKNANYALKFKKAIHKVEGEDIEEDPTLDEYHNMKGKKEDDDSTQKPTNESMRVDHFANLSARVQLEQPLTNFRIQPEVKGEGRTMKTDIIII